MTPLFTRRHEDESLTLYYASDIHGSELLWRKFLGAGAFYGADASIMGGDLLGKAVVPIEQREDGRYRLTFLGAERVIGEDELAQTESSIRFNGFYPWVASADEIAGRRGDQEGVSTRSRAASCRAGSSSRTSAGTAGSPS